ncbi:MAG: hypothetical protein IPJ14_15705 [Kineosporiaceae bacterium]|nr:hypothetical protein [Kineosporiaceae bacterium]MBK7624060.1 hypothetical protein [Kineosporiaceae bacterium]MBK8075815.1 hypothetical protein [Kineosporiaceae bacterium]
MADEDDELRQGFRRLGAWYEHQAVAAATAPRASAAPRRPRRRALVGLSALAAGVGVVVVAAAVNGLTPRPDDPQITIRPTTVTTRRADPTPTPSPSPSPTEPSPTSSSTPRPSRSTSTDDTGVPTPRSAGAASPTPGGTGGPGTTSGSGGGAPAGTTPAEVSTAPTPVTLSNGNFEQQAPLLGKILGASPPGWTGSSGVLGVGWPRYPSSDVQGLAGPTAMTLFGLITTPARQVVPAPVQAGATYRLTVAVGCRSTPEDFGGARLSILVGGVRVASQDVTVAPACGRFTDVTVTWTASADQAGQPLGIEIAKVNQRLVSYVDIDNVRLTAG